MPSSSPEAASAGGGGGIVVVAFVPPPPLSLFSAAPDLRLVHGTYNKEMARRGAASPKMRPGRGESSMMVGSSLRRSGKGAGAGDGGAEEGDRKDVRARRDDGVGAPPPATVVGACVCVSAVVLGASGLGAVVASTIDNKLIPSAAAATASSPSGGCSGGGGGGGGAAKEGGTSAILTIVGCLLSSSTLLGGAWRW